MKAVSAGKAKRLAKRAATSTATPSSGGSSQDAADDTDVQDLAASVASDLNVTEKPSTTKRNTKSASSSSGRSSRKSANSASSGADGGSKPPPITEADLSPRTCTGVLASLPDSRDICVTSFSLAAFGKVLVSETTVELNYNRRYGLLGSNGCGKSTFLRALAAREMPLPRHLDVYLLSEPAPKCSVNATVFVLDEARKELLRLEELAESIITETGNCDDPRVMDVYDRIDSLDPTSFDSRAAIILRGLGFDQEMLAKNTCDMSGGWRMRVALAKALFLKPTLLLLDEPTAHLDLGACVWLEKYLQRYDRILVVVSHSQDFLNGVCTNMVDMRQQKFRFYGGNYDSYVKTRTEQETNQMKQYNKQQDEIANIKSFIASCGTYANLVKQAKSRQKILDKMIADGLIEKIVPDRVFTFTFPEMPALPPPVLGFHDVCFGYDPSRLLYKNLNIGIDMDSRVALVGPNGVGKSTLLKLILGTLSPTRGRVQRHNGLKIGVYSQHSAEQLDDSVNAIEFMRNRYSHISQDIMYWRQTIGRFGLVKEAQTSNIGTLSDGQRSRIVFAMLAVESPNMLLLDEPTNGLDIPTIDSLAEAINAYSGGVVFVSHDFRLLDKVAKDILVCENQNVKKWEGDILSYKKLLADKMTV